MKVSPMRQKMDELRRQVNDKTLDKVELMLNNSKGTGTTNLLIDAARQSRTVPILVESEQVAEHLSSLHPELKFHPYDKQLPGQKVLIDVSTYWVALRQAQKIRKLAEDLLNWMEYKQRDW